MHETNMEIWCAFLTLLRTICPLAVDSTLFLLVVHPGAVHGDVVPKFGQVVLIYVS